MNPNHPIAGLVRSIVAQLDVVLPRPERVEAECDRLRVALSWPPTAEELEQLERLTPLLARRADPSLAPLFALLLFAAAACREPWALLQGLLLARDEAQALRALDVAARLAESGALVVAPRVARFLAARAELEGDPLRRNESLAVIGEILCRMRAGGAGAGEPVEALYLGAPGSAVRRLAARILDLSGEPAPPGRAAWVLGPEAFAALDSYLRYTRATHLDLLHIAPERGARPPILASFRRAESACGEAVLREIVAELGWPRVSLGIDVRLMRGLSLGGSLPFWLRAPEAPLLESCEGARRVGEHFLVVAQGGLPPEGRETPGGMDPVPRFRAYNLAHAEALADILEVAPLTPVRIQRILGWMDRLVQDFIALFEPFTQECAILPEVYGGLKLKILEELRAEHAWPQLSADLARRVLTFEDPRSLGEVRTLHGLKRYLHQRGLKLGFRLVEAGRATNRSVDLALASRSRVLRVLRRIEYVDFEGDEGPDAKEPGSPAAEPAIPYPVAALVEAFGLDLLQGQESFPDVKVFCYGNEVHYYVAYGNHPAFLRVDYAPPLQGGMVDLEYYGVSKYVLSEHPNPELDALRAFFRRLEFDLEIENTRVHARYDKERVLDLAALCENVEALFRLLPHLMDLDWVVGDLRLKEDARRKVAEAWAGRFLRWGVVPAGRILTADRRGIRLPAALEVGGEQEAAWSGEGEYRDCFCPPPPSLSARLAEALAELGLEVPRLPGPEADELGQVDLERHVLRPLREALARGEIEWGPEGLRRAPADRFRREHEAEAFAAVLDGPADEFADGMRLAGLVVPLERSLHFETTGTVNGYEVQRARLALRGEAIGLFVLRDVSGLARLALFAGEDALWRRRGHEGGPWEGNRSADATGFAALLRRNRYLAPGADPAGEVAEWEVERLREALRGGNPLLPLPALPGERSVSGLRVSPGRATGRAVFGTAGRKPQELLGAVLVAASVRPEDAPFLYHAAGIVSTGGGTLSHAALIAAQFRKPALVIPGRWQREADGSMSLGYSVREYAEEARMVGHSRVAVRRGLRERECRLREGDLLLLDADARTLHVLGQDREALALHEELRQFGEATRRLGGGKEDRELLGLRGRRLRARHQMRKLLARMADPILARHAAHEILLGESLAGESAEGKAGLLSVLLGNRRVAEAARQFLIHVAAELLRREEASRAEALGRIPTSESLHEILAMRLEALRLGHALDGVARALRACGLPAPRVAPPAARELDAPARSRLERMRAERTRSAGEAAGSSDRRARIRHLLRQVEYLDQVLGDSGPEPDPLCGIRAALAAGDRAARGRLLDRRVLPHEECGFETFERVGWKAANLGEVERLAEPERVPAWFVVTHRAFEEMLGTSADPAAAGESPTAGPVVLRSAIDQVLTRRDLDEAQKSARIRALWERAPVPPELAEEVRQAYARLGVPASAAASEAGETGDRGAPFVAVRSSAFEEDTEAVARAGEFDTFLFVRGAGSVLSHLRRAWSGLWSARALRSRALFGSGGAYPGGGVIVQRIVDARVSGVLQTVNLAERELREIVINAGLGLGEGVVSGSVSADHVVVSKEGDLLRGPLKFRYVTADKRERVVFDRRAGAGTVRADCLYHQRLRPALEYTELSELVAIAARLESAYGYPLDIEFALEGDRLWILQARPVGAFRATLRETLERYPLAGPAPPPVPASLEEVRS